MPGGCQHQAWEVEYLGTGSGITLIGEATVIVRTLARMRRTEKMALSRIAMGPAAAWRLANPDSTANDDSAAQLYRRELRWLRDTRAILGPGGEDLLLSALAGTPSATSDQEQEPAPEAERKAESDAAPALQKYRPKECRGVADRACAKVITTRSPRCEDCRAEHSRLKRQGDNRNNYQNNQEDRQEKRRGRYHAQVAEAKRKVAEAERMRVEEEEMEKAAEIRRKREAAKKMYAKLGIDLQVQQAIIRRQSFGDRTFIPGIDDHLLEPYPRP